MKSYQKHLGVFMFIMICSTSSVWAGSKKIVRDVVYSPAAGAAGVGDLYFPEGYTADTPVAVAIHGGSWSGGDRYSWSGVAEFLCNDLGFVVFNIEYRLTGVGPWPLCGNDCIDAANYLLSASFKNEYGINCEKVWPCGGSSGGHLALWTGLSLPPSDVAGIISISGIGDLIPDSVVNPSRYVGFFGHTPTEAELIAASPMTLVTPSSPPVICTHAEIDTVVPPASTQNFVDACRANGVPVEHFTYEQRDDGHSVWIPGSNPHKLFADIEGAIAKFVWNITGTGVVVGQDDFYEEISVTEDTLLTRPLIDNQARKTGAGTATLVNPRMPRSSLRIDEGGVRVFASDTFAAPDLPDALQQKAAFWVDANTNVVADGSGVVSRWHDVREASVSGPYSYMMATNTDVARQPTVVSDAGLDGKNYIDFGKWNVNGKWLAWMNSAGVSTTLSLRSVFIVFGSHNGNSAGGGITLIQSSGSTTHFTPKDTNLWYPSGVVIADDGVNYMDREMCDGRSIQIFDKAYHLIECATLLPASANTFARERSLPQYYGGSRICEAILFTTELTSAERLQVQDYLWHKWFERSGESSLGTFFLGNDAALDVVTGADDLQLTVSGKGTVSKSGSGTVAIMNDGTGSFDGTVRLLEGNLLTAGEPLLFELDEGGQTLFAQDIRVNRSTAAADIVIKTGSGELAVASVDSSVTKISVTDGVLRLATPRVAASATLTNAVVNEHSLEAFDTSATAPWINFTPAGTGVTTVNGWRFDRTAYASGNFLVGVAFDYNRSGRIMAIDSAPDGHTALYINLGLVETDFMVPAPGLYRLSFHAAAWASYPNLPVEVQLDGVAIRTIITLTGAFVRHDILLPFLASGSHTIGFEGLSTANTRAGFIDDIRVSAVRLCDEAPVLASINNPSFEEPVEMFETAVVTSEPTGAGWAFTGLSAIGHIQSLNPAERKMPQTVPEGIGTAMIPITGSISQDVTFPTSGVYRLSFAVAAREGLINHSFNVMFDGKMVRPFKTVDTAFQRVELDLPPVDTGAVRELKFLGTGVADQASLIDDIRIERIEEDTSLPELLNGGFELETNNWDCTLYAGAFPNGNAWGETVPYGTYFGYIALTHSFAQTVTFAKSGNYALRFLTKTRDAYALTEYHDFEVTLNDEVVGYICNMDDALRSFELPLPPVVAGVPYELKFKGLQSYAGNTLSLYDEIAVVPLQSPPKESVEGRFPETMALEVAAGAVLVLDFEGQIKMTEVTYDGHTVAGLISAATHSEFVSGTGSIMSPPQGTIILVK